MLGDDLPVILVSAVDVAAASAVISELIDNEVCVEGASPECRVWQLDNKYYSARVSVRALADGQPAPAALQPEAHLIYFTENECAGAGSAAGEALARRAAAARGAGSEVRLALCACAGDALPPELSDAARLHHYEVVSMSECSEPAEGPFPELAGRARAREALHAHPWPGLRMRAPEPHRPHPAHDDDEFSPFQSYQNGRRSSGSSDGGSSEEPSEAECVRRAELFAEALGALPAVRGAGGGERLLRAEQLVAAFCRALGTDLDSL